jgi:hypothetical protein
VKIVAPDFTWQIGIHHVFEEEKNGETIGEDFRGF